MIKSYKTSMKVCLLTTIKDSCLLMLTTYSTTLEHNRQAVAARHKQHQ